MEKSGLTQIHTFPYSKREGTIGANMENQIPDDIKSRRADKIKEISRGKYNSFVTKNIGKIHEIFIEKHRDKHSGNLKGVTRNYLTVQIHSEKEDLYNTLQKAKITRFENGIIYAIIPKPTAPINVVFVNILSKASAVGRPGLIPGIDDPYFFKLSAISFGCIFGIIEA